MLFETSNFGMVSYLIKNENVRRLKLDPCKSGCKNIIDLFNQETKELSQYKDFCRKYRVNINILDYCSLTQSIKKHMETWNYWRNE
jgi:hypothetical protein